MKKSLKDASYASLGLVIIVTAIASSFQIPGKQGDPANASMDMQAEKSEVTKLYKRGHL